MRVLLAFCFLVSWSILHAEPYIGYVFLESGDLKMLSKCESQVYNNPYLVERGLRTSSTLRVNCIPWTAGNRIIGGYYTCEMFFPKTFKYTKIVFRSFHSKKQCEKDNKDVSNLNKNYKKVTSDFLLEKVLIHGSK